MSTNPNLKIEFYHLKNTCAEIMSTATEAIRCSVIFFRIATEVIRCSIIFMRTATEVIRCSVESLGGGQKLILQGN